MPIGRIIKILDVQDLSILPVYELNTEALSGGLAVNDLYRTSTGQLMIVY